MEAVAHHIGATKGSANTKLQAIRGAWVAMLAVNAVSQLGYLVADKGYGGNAARS